MKNFSWKLEFALLTFFVGTVLVLIWASFGNKPIEIMEAQSRPSEIRPLAKVI